MAIGAHILLQKFFQATGACDNFARASVDLHENTKAPLDHGHTFFKATIGCGHLGLIVEWILGMASVSNHICNCICISVKLYI